MLELLLLACLVGPASRPPLPGASTQDADPPPVEEPVTDDEELDIEADYDRHSRRAAERDAFEVFDHPEMLDPEEAEQQGIVSDDDIVLGVAHGDEAKAYPLAVMGSHELGNDTVGGVPIAPSW